MKGWFGDRMAHSLASRGIVASIYHNKEDMYDYDYRYVGTAFWNEYDVRDAKDMDDAINTVLEYELQLRLEKIEGEYIYEKERFINMSDAGREEILEDLEISSNKFLDDLKKEYEEKKKIITALLKGSTKKVFIMDGSYEEDGVYYIDVATDYIESMYNKYVIRWRGY